MAMTMPRFSTRDLWPVLYCTGGHENPILANAHDLNDDLWMILMT